KLPINYEPIGISCGRIRLATQNDDCSESYIVKVPIKINNLEIFVECRIVDKEDPFYDEEKNNMNKGNGVKIETENYAIGSMVLSKVLESDQIFNYKLNISNSSFLEKYPCFHVSKFKSFKKRDFKWKINF
ncbi:hypothetical protein PIROE2DRAFT_11972, partial [Piromyces sp. E2]